MFFPELFGSFSGISADGLDQIFEIYHGLAEGPGVGDRLRRGIRIFVFDDRLAAKFQDRLGKDNAEFAPDVARVGAGELPRGPEPQLLQLRRQSASYAPHFGNRQLLQD